MNTRTAPINENEARTRGSTVLPMTSLWKRRQKKCQLKGQYGLMTVRSSQTQTKKARSTHSYILEDLRGSKAAGQVFAMLFKSSCQDRTLCSCMTKTWGKAQTHTVIYMIMSGQGVRLIWGKSTTWRKTLWEAAVSWARSQQAMSLQKAIYRKTLREGQTQHGTT